MIYLLRHGDAEDGEGEDASRRLTPKGVRQAQAAGRALVARGAKLDTCFASPKLRAAETARLACEPLGIELEIAAELRGGRFDALRLAAGRGEVLLVGHEPDFSAEVARLTGAKAKLAQGRAGDRRRLDADGAAETGRPRCDCRRLSATATRLDRSAVRV